MYTIVLASLLLAAAALVWIGLRRLWFALDNKR
jgi:hypothetical protein